MKLAGETEANLIIRHQKCINAHFQPALGDFKSGQYIPDLPFSGYYSFEPAAGSLFAGIFAASVDMEIDRLAVNIASPADEGKSLRLGIYACRADLYPGTLILDAGTASASEAGTREIAINQILERGYYNLAVLLENPCGLNYLKLAQSPLGMYPAMSAVFAGYGCEPGWGELPLEFPSGATASNVMKMVIARVARIVQ